MSHLKVILPAAIFAGRIPGLLDGFVRQSGIYESDQEALYVLPCRFQGQAQGTDRGRQVLREHKSLDGLPGEVAEAWRAEAWSRP